MATIQPQINKRVVVKKAIGEFWRKAKNIETRPGLRAAADELELPKLRRARGASMELAGLKKHRPDLIETYLDAAKKCPEDYSNDLLRYALKKAGMIQKSGHQAVYEKLGVTLIPLSENMKNDPAYVELVESRALFEMFVYGGLLEQIHDMTGVNDSSNLTIERMGCGTEVYKASLGKDENRRSVYIKETSVEPDIFAARGIVEHGYVVPIIKNVSFKSQRFGQMQYGVLQDIQDAENVRDAVSIRAIARNPKFASYVKEDLPHFIEMLGRFFETCRKLGIQDRHDRNVFIIEKNDGTFRLGTIDLDIVACYRAEEKSMDAFAGQFYRILDSVYFSLYYEKDVRGDPKAIRKLMVQREVPLCSWIRKTGLCQSINNAFLKGVMEAHSFYLEKENVELVKRWLKSHNRGYVGWGVGQDRIHRLTTRKDETDMNGERHKLEKEGPNKGRIKLKWRMAWEHGFLKTVEKDSNVPDFWKGVFDIWSGKLFDWIRDGPRGKIQPVATISY